MLVFIYVGLFIFSSKREHLLSVLLRLEFMALGLYLILVIFIPDKSIFFSLIYLTFAACEGALGLSILVVIRRTHGGDYFKRFDFLIN
jgi:NADH:ubiquinone oxidoreductase subunit K